jgi:hypothetical protein
MASSSNRNDDVISLPRSEWKDWTGAEEALSKLARAAGASRSDEPDASPGAEGAERKPDPPATSSNPPATSPSKVPPGRGRLRRTLLRYGAAVCLGIVGTLAWQSHGDTAKHMAASAITAAWQAHGEPWFTDLWQSYGEPVRQTVADWFPNVPTDPSSVPAQHATQPAADQATAPVAAERVDARSPAESRNLEALARELAELRKAVEQIAARQDQIGSELGKLQASERLAPQVTSGASQPGASPPRRPTSPGPRG